MNKLKLWDELVHEFRGIQLTDKQRELLRQFAPEGYYPDMETKK